MSQYKDSAATTVEAFYYTKDFGTYNLGAGATGMLREFSGKEYILVTGEYPSLPEELSDRISVSLYQENEPTLTFMFRSSFDLEDMPSFNKMSDAKKWFESHIERALVAEVF